MGVKLSVIQDILYVVWDLLRTWLLKTGRLGLPEKKETRPVYTSLLRFSKDCTYYQTNYVALTPPTIYISVLQPNSLHLGWYV